MDLAAMVYLGGLVFAEALSRPCRLGRSRRRPMGRFAESSALRAEILVLTAVA
jgi:hypothetical protein